MANRKQHAAIDFQGAATIKIGGAAGSSGQVLTSGGSGAAMTWGSGGSGGGDKVRISTTTLSNTRYFDLTPFSATYRVYEIYFDNCKGSGTDGTSGTSPEAFIMRAYTSGGIISGSEYEYYSDASPGEGGDEEDCMIDASDGPLSFFCCALDRGEFSGKITLFNPTDANSYKFIESRFQSRVLNSTNYYADTGTKYWNTHGSVNSESNDLTKIKFYCVRGSVVTGPPQWGLSGAGIGGSVSVYGLKHS